MSGTETRMPISSHPAFPWVVGLYFAVLLAGGLFVMPDAVHVNLRSWLGIEALVGNALSAKLVLSVLAGILGLLVGVAIARRVSGAKAKKLSDERSDTELAAPAIDPDNSAHDDSEPHEDAVWLGDDDLGEEPERSAPEEAPHRMFNPRDYLTEDGLETGPEIERDTIVSTEPVDAEFEEVEVAAESGHLEPEDHDREAEPELTNEWFDVGSEQGSEELEEPAATTADMPEVVEPETQPALPRSEAMGDLSLAELTGRLERALAAQRKAEDGDAQSIAPDADPVIAFLRREADRKAPPASAEGEDKEDTQTSLRSALERLSQVSKRS
ncbi:hypothetical protein Q9K02_02140 [Qipengyuania sp. G39]|uniref:Uncharacterized protein n=1 Tax=Qipengyuania profundimaris TaxID=3067652 RepID=A0ABT9HLC4_9SPHN|nr:hypothetical protein [Qipengyuania sp. G39]MDP4573938.1 hypothetical protein [Qipengyuania sp. G39]